jgi:hypothetical protein
MFRQSARCAALHRSIFLSPPRSVDSRVLVPSKRAQNRAVVALARVLLTGLVSFPSPVARAPSCAQGSASAGRSSIDLSPFFFCRFPCRSPDLVSREGISSVRASLLRAWSPRSVSWARGIGLALDSLTRVPRALILFSA